MSLVNTLQNLGLSEKEAAIYIALVELGESTVGRIATKSGVKRPTVYLILDELRLKGLVSKIPYPKKQIFAAKDPDELIAESEAKLRAVRGALPELMALAGGASKPKVMLFEGIEGVRELLWYGLERLRGKELVGFYGHTEHMPKEFLDLALDYNDKFFLSHDISVRGIAPDHETLKKFRDTDTKYNRVIKVVPKETYNAEMSIDIGDTFIKILSFKDLQGVVIENEHIAKVQKQIFEMVWAAN